MARRFRRCAVTAERWRAADGLSRRSACALPGQAFWQNQGSSLKFRPQAMDVDQPLPHIRLDAALEFLIGDKLR
jgi:hypothetical protein